MKVLLAFLLVTFLIAIHAANRGKPSRAWVLLAMTFVVSLAYLTRRAY